MAQSSRFPNDIIHQIGNVFEVPKRTTTAEKHAILNFVNNSVETNHCNLSEIIQLPGGGKLTPVQVLVPSNSTACIPVFTISQMVEDDTNTQNKETSNPQKALLSTEPKNLEEVKILEIVVSNAPEKRHNRNIEKQRSNKPITIFEPIPDRKVLPRAQAVLPLCLKYRNGIVTPKANLPNFVLFGPVEGIVEKLTHTEARHLVVERVMKNKPIFLIPNEDGSFVIINVSDQDKSNWISLLPLGDHKTANVWLHLIESKVYAVTTKSIPSGQALSIGYTRNYAKELGIPDSQPLLDLCDELNKVRAGKRCEPCDLSFETAFELDLHNSGFHKKADNKQFNRNKYRCKHCLRRFTRLFSLRRHVLRCSKKQPSEVASLDADVTRNTEDNSSLSAITKPQNGKEKLPSEQLCSQTEEEQRLPSDESLQNYTNILDFSTNLFDTDRMLDCSLKSDIDFYPVGLKDDRLANDFEFPDGLFSSSPKKQVKKNSTEDKWLLPFTCPYCKETIVRNKYRQHSQSCPARLSACRCGKKFRQKRALALHMLKERCDLVNKPKKTDSARTKNSIKSKESPLHTKENEKTKEESLKIQTDLPERDDQTEEAGAQNETNDVIPPCADESGVLNNKYPCPQCTLVFKRRGMLVNHLWRAHGGADDAGAARSVAPLVVAERRYPCPLCLKTYGSAAKRKLHISARHPGVPLAPTQLTRVELGGRAAAAARCWACPRQYATRAKLLQHAREHHPRDAPPPLLNKKSKLK